MKVYLVSTGEYSDYSVEGIYSTRELAEEAVKRFASHNDIKEFELDAMPELKDGLYGWRVRFDGENIASTQREGIDFWSWREHRRTMFCVDDETYGPARKKGDVTVYCFARDEEHANKVAIDKRREALLTYEMMTPAERKSVWIHPLPEPEASPTAAAASP